jgi:GNAT superfamily N-acetyltransferase
VVPTTGEHNPRGAAPSLRSADISESSNSERLQYRSQPHADRSVMTRYADPLGDVVDAVADNPNDRGPEVQLAADLSGRYGRFAVLWKSVGSPGAQRVEIEGDIVDQQGSSVGGTLRRFSRENDFLLVDNELLFLHQRAQRQGFSAAFYSELETYYSRSGVDIIRVHAALDVGGYAWASYGFDWDPHHVTASFQNLRVRIAQLLGSTEFTARDKQILRETRDQLDELDPFGEWPAPVELASLAGDDRDLGRKLLLGTSWYGVYTLSAKGEGYGS